MSPRVRRRGDGSRRLRHWLAGFHGAELERLAVCVARLWPGLRADEIAVTGGVAIQIGMAQLGHAGARKGIDPETWIRVDIFPDRVGSLVRSRAIQIGTQPVRALALEDILEHKLLTLSSASPSNPVDPEHADDAYTLGKLFQRRIAAVASSLRHPRAEPRRPGA
jgi:hypothetical protein